MDDSASARNDQIYQLLAGFLESAEQTPEYALPFHADEVETLFNTPIWGHRELVLTILLTRLVFPQYKATVDLYEHHPRSVYEKPIRTAFRQYGIPHKKSGPLNVAKNIKRLNMDWATDKNDEKVAVSAVKIVEKAEKVSIQELEQFVKAYVSRYKLEASRVKDLEVDLPPQQNPIFISKLCTDLINDMPDGGATAQYITGLLMDISSQARGSEVTVTGYLDSVSATNTTSKKPGDVIESLSSKGELVYEVTTKAFNDDRMIESHEAVTAFDEEITDVFVICRPDDVLESLEVAPNTYLMASTQFRQLSYYFVNIYLYIQSMILFIPTDYRGRFYAELTNYINETNRAEKVKIYFAEWHSKTA